MSVLALRITALLIVAVWALTAPPHVSAQLGSLIVTITEPAAGSTAGGTIALTARVTVVGALTARGVQFTLDGVNLGAENTSAPYSIQWDTRTASNGSHTLRAVARDLLGVHWTSNPVAITVFNDQIRPTVRVLSPAAGATLARNVTVTAEAADNVGVVGVQFRLDGIDLGAEDTTPPYSVPWNTTTVTDGAHALTAVARDSAANTATSSTVTVTVSNAAPRSAIRFENTDLSITYMPGTPGPGQPPAWFHGSRSRDWSNATAAFNRSAGARATFHFTGTQVSWIGFRAYWAGIARVFVDDAFASEIDLFLPFCTPEEQAQGCIHEEDQVPVFTAAGLTPGAHRLTVEITGGKNPAATDNAVVVDAFDVVGAPSLPVEGARSEEAASSFTAGWTQGDATVAWSGGTAARSATAGARTAFTFTGTEVRWIGLRAPDTGIARIILDGSFHADVDTYSPTAVQGVLFSATGLAAGRHVLTVEVTGTKNAAATNHLIFVDGFDVRSRLEERDHSISYAGAWVQENMDQNWSGTTANAGSGTAAFSATAGATATLTFNGTAVSWIGYRGPVGGIANVYLDDVFVAERDLYSPTEELRAAVFSAAGLAPGTHSLRIEATGTRNGAATGAFVVVDALDVTLPAAAPPVSRVEQTASSVVFTTPPDTAGWAHSTPNNLFSGGTVALSTTAGSRSEFTFTGRAVRWIGQRRRDTGIARVFVDGTFVAQVDTFAPIQDEIQAAVFTATDLPPGQHVLTIEVTGQMNAASSGNMVIVDAFEVY